MQPHNPSFLFVSNITFLDRNHSKISHLNKINFLLINHLTITFSSQSTGHISKVYFLESQSTCLQVPCSKYLEHSRKSCRSKKFLSEGQYRSWASVQTSRNAVIKASKLQPFHLSRLFITTRYQQIYRDYRLLLPLLSCGLLLFLLLSPLLLKHLRLIRCLRTVSQSDGCSVLFQKFYIM